ncbi:hypothetical protein EBR96_08125, partial [bacterium]|nr:hypothetical protein [bacterium]
VVGYANGDPNLSDQLAAYVEKPNPDIYDYEKTSPTAIITKLGLDKIGIFNENTAPEVQRDVAARYGTFARLDQQEAAQIKKLADIDLVTQIANDGFDFWRINYQTVQDAYKEMTKINAIRTFMVMIEQAMYNAKQNAIRAMFGSNAAGQHGALSYLASAIDRYINSVMGTIAGQTGVTQDLINTEATNRVTARNVKAEADINYGIEQAFWGITILLTASGYAGRARAALLASTAGLAPETSKAVTRKIARRNQAAGMLKSLAQISLGIAIMARTRTDNPQVTSELLNYSEEPEVASDASDEVRQDAKLKGKPSSTSKEGETRTWPQSGGPTGVKDASKQNLGVDASQATRSDGLRQRVNVENQERASRYVQRKARQVQMLREISLAVSDAKGDIGEDLGGGASAKNAYRLSLNIVNQYSNLEQRSVEFLYASVRATTEAYNELAGPFATQMFNEIIAFAVESAQNGDVEFDNFFTNNQFGPVYDKDKDAFVGAHSGDPLTTEPDSGVRETSPSFSTGFPDTDQIEIASLANAVLRSQSSVRLEVLRDEGAQYSAVGSPLARKIKQDLLGKNGLLGKKVKENRDKEDEQQKKAYLDADEKTVGKEIFDRMMDKANRPGRFESFGSISLGASKSAGGRLIGRLMGIPQGTA